MSFSHPVTLLRKHTSTLLALSIVAVLCLQSSVVDAKKVNREEKTLEDKERAENQKATIENQLKDLQSKLEANEAQKENATGELQKADTAISEANRKLRQLDQDRRRIEREIQNLKRDANSVGKELSSANTSLNMIARTQYLTIQKNPWQALLNGQNPNEIYRDNAMMRYLTLAQQKQLQSLTNEQTQIRNVTAEHQSQQEELLKIKRAEEEQRQILIKEKRDRERALSKLGAEIQSQQNQIDRLKKDQVRLANLVNTIEEQIRKQAEERKAREEKERQERLARQKAQQEARARAQREKETANKKTPAPEPEEQEPERTPVREQPGNQELKGLGTRLARPVKGALVASFGSARGHGNTWQGLQYEAPEGTEVVACADGRVVYADWLRGYGNLIIIDHGKGYLSVYGNNETLIKQVGDSVKQGETISTVGSSGGNTQAGLYFELRHNGKPINPMPWLSR